eukprot:304372-Chlamydomonas_euryale.AAC.3
MLARQTLQAGVQCSQQHFWRPNTLKDHGTRLGAPCCLLKGWWDRVGRSADHALPGQIAYPREGECRSAPSFLVRVGGVGRCGVGEDRMQWRSLRDGAQLQPAA